MRRPNAGRRGRIAAAAALAAALLLVVVVAVPPARDGLTGAWCALTGCPPGDGGPGRDSGEEDWRVRLDPVEAATWGHYVAIGDSYSSGDGAGDYLTGTTGDDGCWRSANSYPSRTAEAFDFAGGFGFEACSKERADRMLEEAGDGSQLDRITEFTSLVSVGIGGNDLGFTPVLRTCMVRMPLLSSGVCTGQEESIDRRMGAVGSSVEEIIAEVRDRAPDARVLLLGYPRLFPDEPPGMYYTLTVEDQVWLNGTVERFNDRLRRAAEEADEAIAEDGGTGSVEFVDVYDTLDGHEVSVEESWLNGVVLRSLTEGISVDRSSFHPTSAGQAAFGDRVEETVSEGPGRDLYAARERVDGAEPEVLARDLAD